MQGGSGRGARACSSTPSCTMVGKTRFGRPVLSAKLKADTPFTATKKAVQTNLHSMDAAGNPVYARYNIALGDEAKAQELVSKALACRPAA